MKRAFVTPPELPAAALAELKAWLGITTAHDDAGLAALLRAAMEMCEAFTGLLPLEASCEEVLPATSAWQALATRLVLGTPAVDDLPADGPRFALPLASHAIDITADGTGMVRITGPVAAGRVVVRFTAGLEGEWQDLPQALRHGIIRLAAHQHRARDDDRVSPLPPASVAALWRPWRRLRLA